MNIKYVKVLRVFRGNISVKILKKTQKHLIVISFKFRGWTFRNDNNIITDIDIIIDNDTILQKSNDMFS